MESLLLAMLVAAPCIAVLVAAASSPEAGRIAGFLSAFVGAAICLFFWGTVDPAAIWPPTLLQALWIPGVPVDVTLAVSAFALPFLTLSQGVCVLAHFLRSSRTRLSTISLGVAQASLALAFTAQDLLVFCCALEGFWLALALGAHEKDPEGSPARMAFTVGAGAILLGCAAVLGAVHLEQFQQFSTRLGALRELKWGSEPVLLDLSLSELVLGAMLLSTVLRSTVVPAHRATLAFMTKSDSGGLFAVALAAPLMIFTWLQWIAPVLPEAFGKAGPLLVWWLVPAAIYAATLAFQASDLKSWLGAVASTQCTAALLGLALPTADSATGSILLALAGSAALAGLWTMACWMEHAFGSRDAFEIGSLHAAPRATLLLALTLAATLGFPLSGVFASLLLVLSGLVQGHFLAGSGLALAWAVLLVGAFRAVLPLFFGKSPLAGVRTVPDLPWRAVAAVGIFLVASFALGVRPSALRTKTDPVLKTFWKTPLQAGGDAKRGRDAG